MRFYKCLMALIVVMTSANLCFADVTKRLSELQEEAKGLMEKRQQYVQATQQIEVRLIEIQGIAKELQAQDKPVTTGTGN